MLKIRRYRFLFLIFPSLLIVWSAPALSSETNQPKKIFISDSKDKKYGVELLPGWKKIEPGIGLQRVNLFNKFDETEVQLKLYKFNPELFDLHVLCSEDFGSRRSEVREMAELSGSIAIINGSYFDTEGKPIAFLKCNNKVMNKRVATHSLYSGVFYVKKGRPHIVHSSKFKPADEITDAVQVGPRLLTNGVNTIGLRNIHAVHHRSGIALDRQGNVIIYATNSLYGGISWNVLRQILSLKKIGGHEVLNLDGGGSTQMYISTGKHEDHIRGFSPVPSAIAVFRKK